MADRGEFFQQLMMVDLAVLLMKVDLETKVRKERGSFEVMGVVKIMIKLHVQSLPGQNP